jgi:hypothetical protein
MAGAAERGPGKKGGLGMGMGMGRGVEGRSHRDVTMANELYFLLWLTGMFGSSGS